MSATEKNVWLIEKTGETRHVWGPYTQAHAEREAGVRHAIVTGGGLENGQTMTRGEVVAAVQSGRIRPVNGSLLS